MSRNGTYDDTHPQIQYAPNDVWQLESNLNLYGPYTGTVHGATQANAKATILFFGSSVSVSCLLWPTGSNLTVTFDGDLIGTYNTAAVDAAPKVMFTIDNLLYGVINGMEHGYILTLEKAPNDPGWVSSVPGDDSSHLYIDSITIGGASSSPSNSTSVSQLPTLSTSITQSQLPSSSTLTSQSQFPPSSTAPSTELVAGIVVSVVLIVATLVAFIWYRRRRTQAALQFTGPSPFIEAGTQPDAKVPERITRTTYPPIKIPFSLAPVQEQAVALVPLSSSHERGAAAVVATTTSEKSQSGGRNNSYTDSSLELSASSIPPPSTLLSSSSASGGANMSLILQEDSMLRDQVRRFAALQLTGGGAGFGGSLYNESRPEYHEPPPEYEGRCIDDEDRH